MMNHECYMLGQQTEYLGWRKDMNLSDKIFPYYFKTVGNGWWFIDVSKIDTLDKMWSFLKGTYSVEGTQDGFVFANSAQKFILVQNILQKIGIEYTSNSDTVPHSAPTIKTILLKDPEYWIKKLKNN